MSYFSCLCYVCFITYLFPAACSNTSNDQRCAMSELDIEEYEDVKVRSVAVNLIQRLPIFEKSVRAPATHELQTLDGGRRVYTSTSPPTEYLKTATPLTWTHVPKCGSTLINSLVRLPGVCPGLITNETDVVWNIDSRNSNNLIDPEQPNWIEAFPDWDERCPGLRKLPGVFYLGQHISVGSYFASGYDGRGVIMMRQPEQRIISAYKYVGDHLLMSISAFARTTEGCAVRMLTKEPRVSSSPHLVIATSWYSSYCMKSDVRDNPSASDVKEARKRLRGYAFVGITEEWETSICLFHAMFGGQCNPAEFSNVRGQSSNKSEPYDTGVLEGFTDQYDGALYEEALSIFSMNLHRYGVSEESCQQCFETAGI